MQFKGFSPEGLEFLKDLAANNNKEWFEKFRSVYQEHLLKPLKQLTTELGPAISSIDPEIDTTPAINRTISKIFRDVRFSNDKSPFRTLQWISFRRPNKIWGNVPEFYFYFTPEEYHTGMGFYSATPANMGKFREHIDLYPERFARIIDLYNTHGQYAVEGEEYKKTFPNERGPEYQRWYRKKNLYVTDTRKIDDLFFSSELEQKIEDDFNNHSLLYLFLIESIFG